MIFFIFSSKNDPSQTPKSQSLDDILHQTSLADPLLLKQTHSKAKPIKQTKKRTKNPGISDLSSLNAPESSVEKSLIYDRASRFVSSAANLIIQVPDGVMFILPKMNSIYHNWIITIKNISWTHVHQILAKSWSQASRKTTFLEEREGEESGNEDIPQPVQLSKTVHMSLSQQRRKKLDGKKDIREEEPKQDIYVPISISDLIAYKGNFKGEGLNEMAIETLYHVLCLGDKSIHKELNVLKKDFDSLKDVQLGKTYGSLEKLKQFELLLKADEFKHYWSSPHLQKELARRIKVAFGQLHYYEINIVWLSRKSDLHVTQATLLNSLFQIDQDWPTFTNLDKEHSPALTLEGFEMEQPRKNILKYTLQTEYERRKLLISYMQTRLPGKVWWVEEDLRNARRLGINILIIFKIGDLLNFEQPSVWRTSLLDKSKAYKIVEKLIDVMEVEEDGDRIYGIDTGQWGGSAAKLWLLRQPKLGQLYKSRIQTLITTFDKLSLKLKRAKLENLGIYDDSVWWNLGDLLLWSEQGLTSWPGRGLRKWHERNPIIKKINDVGKKLDLWKSTEISHENLQPKLNALLKGVDAETKAKIKLYFNTRAQWNMEQQPYLEKWASAFYGIKDMLTRTVSTEIAPGVHRQGGSLVQQRGLAGL